MSKSFSELLSSPEWQELSRLQEEGRVKFEKESEMAWDSLGYDWKLRVFYAVCKRIYKGDVVDKGSYRYVLYDVFGFDPDAYAIGMECGYMAIHNAIVDIEELEELKKENAEMKKLLARLEDDRK